MPRMTVIVSGDGMTCELDVRVGTDFDQPFTGKCRDTGETIRVSNPWACDIEIERN